MGEQEQQATAPQMSAASDPANQDRRNFLAWNAQYGMWVEDASAMCAGVHDHGWATADEFAAFMGATDVTE